MRIWLRLVTLFLVLATSLPTLIALDYAPVTGTFQQLVALLLWGIVVAVLGLAGAKAQPPMPWQKAVLALLVVTAFGTMAQSFKLSQSLDSGLLTAGLLLAAAAVFWSVARSAVGTVELAIAVFIGLILAGLFNAVVVMVQVLAPHWADDIWIATGSLPGRGNGNLRQPNHMAMLLLWSGVALVALVDLQRVSWRAASGVLALMMLALLLTASRIGLLGCVLIGIWAALDRGMPKRLRRGLLLMPALALLAWAVAMVWTELHSESLTLTTRLASGAGSSGRTQVWGEAIRLILSNPVVGVGWGEFNFAWTLSPKAEGQTHYYGNAHNLPLQLAAELGVPLTMLVLAVLAYAFWSAWRGGNREQGAHVGVKRAAFVMLMLVAIHSLVEYPLWYAIFLLPSSMLLGLCAASTEEAPTANSETSKGAKKPLWMVFAGLCMTIAAGFAGLDYMKIMPLVSSGERASLPVQLERLRIARQSMLYSWVAYRATARSMPGDPFAIPAARYAAHGALDVPLMIVWAEALNASGETEKARYLAQRVAEFDVPEATAYFARCKTMTSGSAPYQCAPPTQQMSFRDFR